MPLRLDPPRYGPAGPDGKGWNRLSLNAHFDSPHHCGLLPTSFATLFEARTGRQRWGGYERCVSSGPCTSCTVYRTSRAGPHLSGWPSGTPLLLGRVRDWPRTPGLEFADPAAGRSSVHLHTWQGAETGVRVEWPVLAAAADLALTWQFRDEDGEAFWLVRLNPAVAEVTVRSKAYEQHTRHVLYTGGGRRRLALVKCHGTCAHEDWHLRHLAADLSDLVDAAPGGGLTGASAFPELLPGLRSFALCHADGTTTIRHAASRDFGASTMTVDAYVPTSSDLAAALLAHLARVAAW